MCTVTWTQEADGYQLLCNRDEKRTRAQAAAPRLQTRDGVRFIAPADGDFGGTWISANEFGVTLCLLNGAPGSARVSRGLFLLELAPARSVVEVAARFSERDLTNYAPFTVATLEPNRAEVMTWDGNQKALRPTSEAFLTSSSFDPEGVAARRRAAFERRLDLFSFHASHGPRADAYSTCMHRADAETVSFSWIRVTGSEVGFFYTPAAPCKWAPGESLSLPRKMGTCL
jgi:hypothetical protein